MDATVPQPQQQPPPSAPEGPIMAPPPVGHSEPPKKSDHNILKLLGKLFAGCLTLIFIVVFAVYVYMLPRLRITGAISKTFQTDAIEVNLEVQDFDENIKEINIIQEVDTFKNSSTHFKASKINSESKLQSINVLLKNIDGYSYSKINFSSPSGILEQMLNALTAESPEYKNVFIGDAWFQQPGTTNLDYNEDNLPGPLFTVVSAFASLAFELENVGSVDSENSDLQTYIFRPRENMEWSFTQSYSSQGELTVGETAENVVSEQDLMLLAQVLGNTQNIHEAEIEVVLSKRDKMIKQVTVRSPRLNAEVKDANIAQVLTEEITPVGYLLQKLINKTNKNSQVLTELFSANFELKDSDFTLAAPVNTIELADGNEDFGRIASLLVADFFSKDDLISTMMQSADPFEAKVLETTMYLNNKDYQSMLTSSEELLTLVTNEDQKAMAHYFLGYAHFNLGNTQAATDAINVVREIDPELVESFSGALDTSVSNQPADSSGGNASGQSAYAQKEVEPGVMATINSVNEEGSTISIDVTFANIGSSSSGALSPIRISMAGSNNLVTAPVSPQILQLPLKAGEIRTITMVYNKEVARPYIWRYATSSGSSVELGRY